jgi:nucleoside phosphorylase
LTAQSGRKGSAVIGLMTVTVEEAAIVDRVFALSRIPGTAYTSSRPLTDSCLINIVHRRSQHQTNTVSVQTAGDIIEDFRPQYLIVVGTAGGRSQQDGLRLGDVVVADYLDYSGYWKYAAGRVLERKLPHDHPSGHLLESYVEALRADPTLWTTKITSERPEVGLPTLFVGGIVSGNTLLGDPDNDEQKRILEHFEKAYAFEMEGYGLSSAVYKARSEVHYNPQYLIVRGISDLVDTDAAQNGEARKKWTDYAVNAAAAFTSALVADFLRVNGYPTQEANPGGAS